MRLAALIVVFCASIGVASAAQEHGARETGAKESGAKETAAPDHGGKPRVVRKISTDAPNKESSAKEAPGKEAREDAAAPAHEAEETPAAEEPDFAGTVRQMQQMQDRVAIGDTKASAAQASLLEQAGRLATKLGPQVCVARRDRRALLAVLMSGGDPSWGRPCLEAKEFSPVEAHLLRGAMAYAGGRGNEAITEFKDVDPVSLPPSIAGQVALVRASLTLGVDRPLGIRFLDVARLFQPGGLVEEAALRQEIFALTFNGDLEKFSLLARQYIQRFPKSLYADNFTQGFVRGVIELGLAADDARFEHLRSVVDMLTPEAAASVYLLIARRGLLEGAFGAARRAVGEARKTIPSDSSEKLRADLYEAAASITSRLDSEAAVKTLEAMPSARVPPRDRAIRAAAILLSRQIRKPSVAAIPPGGFEPSPVMQKTSDVLAAAQTLTGLK